MLDVVAAFAKGVLGGLAAVLLFLGIAFVAARLLPGDPHDTAGVGVFIAAISMVGGFMAVFFRKTS